MYKIMIIEDDKIIAREMKTFLESWDYQGILVHDFHQVLEEWQNTNPDLILMDISLPYKNGYYWTEQIRKYSKVPIIFISSRNDNTNIVMALSQGGDDFIAKPFDLQVLLYKIKALLRRTYDFSGKTEWLEQNGVRFNMDENLVTYQDRSVELTKNEGKILRLLMKKKDKIVRREELMEYLWKTDYYVDENALSVNINRLRKNLERIGIHDFIQTKKGLGYLV